MSDPPPSASHPRRARARGLFDRARRERVDRVARRPRRRRSRVDHADLIIVLGAAQYNGTPSPVFRGGSIRPCSCTGRSGRQRDGGRREGSLATRRPRRRPAATTWSPRGFPPTLPLPIPSGARRSRAWWAPRGTCTGTGCESAFLVSDPWHNTRITRMAADLGIRGYASATWTSAATSEAPGSADTRARPWHTSTTGISVAERRRTPMDPQALSPPGDSMTTMVTPRERTEEIERLTLVRGPYARRGVQGPRARRGPRIRSARSSSATGTGSSHSKAFRRLKHKTQVFLAPEGDHYRVRLTHTLDVSQIARTVARALRLNEDLTEAIALGHDLGHTPFGHLGEQALTPVPRPAVPPQRAEPARRRPPGGRRAAA